MKEEIMDFNEIVNVICGEIAIRILAKLEAGALISHEKSKKKKEKYQQPKLTPEQEAEEEQYYELIDAAIEHENNLDAEKQIQEEIKSQLTTQDEARADEARADEARAYVQEFHKILKDKGCTKDEIIFWHQKVCLKNFKEVMIIKMDKKELSELIKRIANYSLNPDAVVSEIKGDQDSQAKENEEEF